MVESSWHDLMALESESGPHLQSWRATRDTVTTEIDQTMEVGPFHCQTNSTVPYSAFASDFDGTDFRRAVELRTLSIEWN